MPQVLFAGYKVPHPLQPYFIIKLQTDGTITPQDVLEKATKDLIGMIATIQAKFEKEMQYKEADATGMRPPAAENPYGSDWNTTGTQDYLDI
jgi:DNA-directed RNA polymerase II subunit RPB11